MTTLQIILIVVCIIALGAVILPLFNRWQFKRLDVDRQILAIMKQTKNLEYFKNISNGKSGYLCFVKNKRKILVYPWVKGEKGVIIITKKNPFDRWDYPEEQERLTSDEINQARAALKKYALGSTKRIVWNDPFENDKAE